MNGKGWETLITKDFLCSCSQSSSGGRQLFGLANFGIQMISTENMKELCYRGRGNTKATKVPSASYKTHQPQHNSNQGRSQTNECQEGKSAATQNNGKTPHFLSLFSQFSPSNIESNKRRANVSVRLARLDHSLRMATYCALWCNDWDRRAQDCNVAF